MALIDAPPRLHLDEHVLDEVLSQAVVGTDRPSGSDQHRQPADRVLLEGHRHPHRSGRATTRTRRRGDLLTCRHLILASAKSRRTRASEPAAATAEPAVAATSAQGRPYARIADGPGLPDAVVERLWCNGRIRTVIQERPDQPGQPSNVLDLGRSHRLVTDKQYRALMLRQHGSCGHPGCRSRRTLQAHHVRHGLHGGRTDLANLVLLCKRLHYEHPDGQLSIVPIGTGRFRYLRYGRDLSERPDAGPIVGAEPVEHEHPDVAPAAATTRWDGSRLDHRYAIHVLARHLSVSA